MNRSSRVLLLYFVVFLSGFAALAYEILWTRQLALILGSTTAAISTVVSAFMGGIALGSTLIGRWIDRSRRCLLVYAGIEMGIAIAALLIMILLPMLASAYPGIVSAVALSRGILPAIRFFLTFALLLVPTSLMGGTFPVLVKAFAPNSTRFGHVVGSIYAVNTLGAVCGSALAGIVILGWLGLHGTNYLAVVLNIACALSALAIEKLGGIEASAAPNEGVSKPKKKANPQPVSEKTRKSVAIAIGISGVFALGYEIVWSRVLGIVLGHSIYAFALVLATYLAGISMGSWLISHFLDRLKRPGQAFALAQLALAALCGTTILLVPILTFQEYRIGAFPLDYILGNLSSTVLLLLPPTLIMGALLPLAIKIYASDPAHVGVQVGSLYGWNTIGSIVGSLLAGFVLIPRLGTQSSLMLLVLGNVILGAFVGFQERWHNRWNWASCLMVILAGFALLNSGGSPLLRDKSVERVEQKYLENNKVQLLYFDEDDVASVGVVREPSGLLRLFTDGNLMTHWGLETLWMAELPYAVVEHPKDALVLCLGMGNTFLAASKYPMQVEAVELCPKVVDAFAFIHPEAARLSGHARILTADARNTVLVSDRRFDFITVDPPPPLYSSGSVNFHTIEFYNLCKKHLRPQGVLCQWIPFLHCTVDEYKSLLKTFRAAFDRTWVWSPTTPNGVGGMGLYLLGLLPEVSQDQERVRRKLLTSEVKEEVARFSADPLTMLLPVPVMTNEDVDAFCGQAPIMDDAHPSLEFPLFRNAGKVEVMDWDHLASFLAARGRPGAQTRPSLKTE